MPDFIKIDTNVKDIVRAFDELIKKVERESGRSDSISIRVELTNVAHTESSDGEKFFYYHAADTGRDPIEKSEGFLVYSIETEAPFFSRSVKLAVGNFITKQATARIATEFGELFSSTLEQYAKTGVPPLITSDGVPVVDSIDADNNESAITLNQLGQSLLSARGSGKGLRELSVKVNSKSGGKEFSTSNFVRALLALNDFDSITGIFFLTVAKQIEHFRDATPIRDQFKLLSASKNNTVVLPPPGGALKDGYAVTVSGGVNG